MFFEKKRKKRKHIATGMIMSYQGMIVIAVSKMTEMIVTMMVIPHVTMSTMMTLEATTAVLMTVIVTAVFLELL